MVTALVGALAAASAPARAQEDPASRYGDAERLEIGKSAVYNHNLGHLAPPILTDQFPPQALCLVVPELCGEDARQVTDVVDKGEIGDQDIEGFGGVQENQPEDTVPPDPATLARPGDLPVTTLAGQARHESAIKFDLPDVPEGHRVDEFTVYLRETQPTFHTSSPAFRQAIVGVLSLAREDTSELPKTAERDPIEVEELQGVEACPIVKAFESGRGRPGSEAPEGSVGSDDPGLACGMGTNGDPFALDDGTRIWEFDLTLAAQAWRGEIPGRDAIPNEGVLLRPVAAPNLAYGDPDLTSSEQITLEGQPGDDASDEERAAAPRFTLRTSEKPEPITFPDGDLSGGTGGTSGAGSGTGAAGGQGGGTEPRTETFTRTLGGSEAQTPADVRGQQTPPQPETGTGGGGEEVALGPIAESNPSTPGWVWLLVPVFLAGAYLVSQALTAQPALARVERQGAMSRLIEQRRGRGSAGGPS